MLAMDYTLDTCTLINIMKNSCNADLIKCHIGVGAVIYISSVSLDEASRKGYSKKQVISKIQESFDTLVTVKEVTEENYTVAKGLELLTRHFHRGDSAIAAFTKENNLTLITYDNGLLKGCSIANIPALNPNWWIGGMVA